VDPIALPMDSLRVLHSRAWLSRWFLAEHNRNRNPTILQKIRLQTHPILQLYIYICVCVCTQFAGGTSSWFPVPAWKWHKRTLYTCTLCVRWTDEPASIHRSHSLVIQCWAGAFFWMRGGWLWNRLLNLGYCDKLLDYEGAAICRCNRPTRCRLK